MTNTDLDEDRLPDEIAIEAAEHARAAETSKTTKPPAESGSRQETDEDGTPDTEADDQAASQDGEPASEQDEPGTAADGETDGADKAAADAVDGEADSTPLKLTKDQKRNQKLRQQREQLAAKDARIAALQRQVEQLRNPDKDTIPEPPRAEDFGEDYDAFDKAQRAYETRMAVREQSVEDRTASTQAELEDAHHDRFELAKEQFNEREDEAKPKLPDYDKKIEAMIDDLTASQTGIPAYVVNEIYQDQHGPEILYLMAEDQSFRRELLNADHVSAVRLIANRSARLSAVTPRKKTKASEPRKAPKGGGDAEPDPEAMSNEQYRTWRKKQSGG